MWHKDWKKMSFELEKILGVYSSQVSERKNEQWWGYELNDLKIIVNLESNYCKSPKKISKLCKSGKPLI